MWASHWPCLGDMVEQNTWLLARCQPSHYGLIHLTALPWDSVYDGSTHVTDLLNTSPPSGTLQKRVILHSHVTN